MPHLGPIPRRLGYFLTTGQSTERGSLPPRAAASLRLMLEPSPASASVTGTHTAVSLGRTPQSFPGGPACFPAGVTGRVGEESCAARCLVRPMWCAGKGESPCANNGTSWRMKSADLQPSPCSSLSPEVNGHEWSAEIPCNHIRNWAVSRWKGNTRLTPLLFLQPALWLSVGGTT